MHVVRAFKWGVFGEAMSSNVLAFTDHLADGRLVIAIRFPTSFGTKKVAKMSKRKGADRVPAHLGQGLGLPSSVSSNVLTFPDCLTGRRVSLALFADGKLQSRDHLHAQILHPLELMQAAAWFVDRQLPGMKRVREDPCVPFGYMLTECSPCVQVRVMFDFVATACRRLATAPAKIRVLYKTTVRWEGRIMELVKRGRVRKVQVWLQRFARLCVVTILLILGCHCLLTL